MTLFDLPGSAAADGAAVTAAAPVAPLCRVRMLVAYDGSGFHGFAPNPGVSTVGGVLAGAIGRVLGHPVDLVCAGRTDAGVHALGQVVSFDTTAAGVDLEALLRSVNGLCGPAVAVRCAEMVPATFDARHSALWRRYRYRVLNQASPDPFEATRAWHVTHPLDLPGLQLACDPLIGEHDFSSFCRRPKVAAGTPVPSMVRRVLEARWDRESETVLRFEIRANAFCHQMVRSIVGLMIDVGRGRRHAGEVTAVLRSRDRSVAGPVAPPHGLYLWEVGYP